MRIEFRATTWQYGVFCNELSILRAQVMGRSKALEWEVSGNGEQWTHIERRSARSGDRGFGSCADVLQHGDLELNAQRSKHALHSVSRTARSQSVIEVCADSFRRVEILCWVQRTSFRFGLAFHFSDSGLTENKPLLDLTVLAGHSTGSLSCASQLTRVIGNSMTRSVLLCTPSIRPMSLVPPRSS